MTTLETKLQNDLVSAMKNHETEKVSAIRSVKTAIQTEKTAGSYHELTEGEIIKIIQKLSKQRQEAAEIYASAGRTEAEEKEKKEKEVLDRYLPKMLTNDELISIVEEIIESLRAISVKDTGKIMKTLADKYSGSYDGGAAYKIIKDKMNK